MTAVASHAPVSRAGGSSAGAGAGGRGFRSLRGRGRRRRPTLRRSGAGQEGKGETGREGRAGGRSGRGGDHGQGRDPGGGGEGAGRSRGVPRTEGREEERVRIALPPPAPPRRCQDGRGPFGRVGAVTPGLCPSPLAQAAGSEARDRPRGWEMAAVGVARSRPGAAGASDPGRPPPARRVHTPPGAEGQHGGPKRPVTTAPRTVVNGGAAASVGARRRGLRGGRSTPHGPPGPRG